MKCCERSLWRDEEIYAGHGVSMSRLKKATDSFASMRLTKNGFKPQRSYPMFRASSYESNVPRSSSSSIRANFPSSALSVGNRDLYVASSFI